MSRAVVLGATGFLGRAVCARLERDGWIVDAVGSARIDLREPACAEQVASLLDPDSVLIAVAAVTRDRGDQQTDFEGNVRIAATVAEALRRSRARKCVYVSSDAVYGDARTNLRITEHTLPAPTTAYGVAKLAGEFLIAQAATERMIPLAILRTCRVYGPGDPHLTYGPARFLAAARDQRAIELFGQGEERRDLLFVEDFAAYAADMAANEAVGTYNLGTGLSRSFAEVARDIAALMPHPVAIRHLPRQRSIAHLGFHLDKLRQVCPSVTLTDWITGLRASAVDSATGAIACHP